MGTVPYIPYEAQEGWKCPCCATVYAPSVQACFCQKGTGALVSPYPVTRFAEETKQA